MCIYYVQIMYVLCMLSGATNHMDDRSQEAVLTLAKILISFPPF